MSQFRVDVEALESFAGKSADLGEEIGELATAAGQITVRDDAFGILGKEFGLVEKFHELRDAASEAIIDSSALAFSLAGSAIESASAYIASEQENSATVVDTLKTD